MGPFPQACLLCGQEEIPWAHLLGDFSFHISDIPNVVEERPLVFQSPGSRNVKTANLQSMVVFDLI
jgi:hypothetical protein